MITPSVEAVVKTVLYEGYILYPYRPSSVKNRQRWTFGCLYPKDCAAQHQSSSMQTECLLKGRTNTVLEVHVRFLHLVNREIGQLQAPLAELPSQDPGMLKVPFLKIGSNVFHAWEEANEREVAATGLTVAQLLRSPKELTFSFPGQLALEPLRDASGLVAGSFIRTSQNIEGKITIAAGEVQPHTFKLTVRIDNTTPAQEVDYAASQRLAFASTHTILSAHGGAFISLLDPPEDIEDAAASCTNHGTWPVLAGEHGALDTMLSSPIILYDYPEVAPESPGDLFDSTEIDEILTLRILAMTDEEKREMAAGSEHARALLERTEALSAEDMARLHGALRNPRFGSDLGGARPARRDMEPELAFLRSGNRDLKIGDRVRLRPKGRADAMDIVLKDELAVIEAIERDFEDRIHIAVVLENDPGREYGLERMPGHRFFFASDEIEAVEQEGQS